VYINIHLTFSGGSKGGLKLSTVMHDLVLYSSLIIAILALFMSLNAGARVGKFIKSTNDLNWEDVANLTGDIATVKKTIQTLNNRMNGMNSPKVEQEAILQQYLSQRQKTENNGKLVGG